MVKKFTVNLFLISACLLSIQVKVMAQPIELGRASVTYAEDAAGIKAPDFNGWDPLGANCAWFNAFKEDISGYPVDPHSTEMLQRLTNNNGTLRCDWSGPWTEPDWNWYTFPFLVVSGNTTPLTIPGTWSYNPTSNGPYMLPPEPVVFENATDTVYQTSSWTDGKDHHLEVFVRDEATGGFKELWEYYQPWVTKTGGEITAVAGSSWRKFDLLNGETPAPGDQAVDAAGMMIMPLCIRYEEVASGNINHALRFCVNNNDISPTFKWPARSYANVWNVEGMPYGTRLRIKQSWWDANADNVLGTGTHARVIGEAMRKHGLILADGSGGSTLQIQGIADLRWDSDLRTKLNSIPVTAFEVVQTPPLLQIDGPRNLNVGQQGTWTFKMMPENQPVGNGTNINIYNESGTLIEYKFAVIDEAHHSDTSSYTFTEPGTYTIKASERWNTGFGEYTVTVGGNIPPTVSITAPMEWATYTEPATVTIEADASDTDGTVDSVVFYQGAARLGADYTSPYSYSWTNVASGGYALTAKAFDNEGASTTSAPPVNITVGPVGGGTTVLVDFGATSAQDAFGLVGWDTAIKDVYTNNVDIGPGGTTITVGQSGEYNYQGVTGSARSFVAGETVRATWYNNSASPVTFTPKMSFTDPDRRDASWYDMGQVTVGAYGTNTSGFTVDAGSAGTYSLVNVNVNYYNNQVLVCDKIELVSGTGNTPPEVSITAPTEGATYTEPATVTIEADASDTDGTVDSVVFYQDAARLGADYTSPYSYSWTNVASGGYALTAKAFDNEGASTTSAPAVNITVGPVGGGTITLVDFGATAAQNTFGLSGWDTAIKDVYTNNVDIGPGGTTITVGQSGEYNYQGVTGSARSFVAGETVRATWYNNSASPVTFTPKMSFTDPDRRDASWYDMGQVTVGAYGTNTSGFTVDAGSAGTYSLVNVNHYNHQVLICDKIELAAGGSKSAFLEVNGAPPPEGFSLSQNYPNPFGPTTVIRYEIPSECHVTLKVLDMLGREVATLVNETRPAGAHEATFNVSSLSGGVYFYKITAGSFTQTKNMTLAR